MKVNGREPLKRYVITIETNTQTIKDEIPAYNLEGLFERIYDAFGKILEKDKQVAINYRIKDPEEV